MNYDDALEWQRLWWLLSLDCVQPFLPDMWINNLGRGGCGFMREILDLKKDLPTIESDPRAKAFSNLERLRKVDDGNPYRILVAWRNIRSIRGANGGAEETMWKLIIRQLVLQGEDLGMDGDTVAILRDFQNTLQERSAVLRERLSLLQNRISVWDKRAIRLENKTADHISHIVGGICTRNLFTQTWSAKCTRRGDAFLEKVFHFALVVVTLESPVDLVFTKETLPYPSSWEIGQEEFLIPLSEQ